MAREPVSAALVTGATSGIGKALALELARRGHPLTLVARDRGRLESVAAEARLLGSAEVRLLAANLLDQRDLERIAEAARECDLLVNAAGMGASRPFPDADLATELAQLDLNVRAPLVLAHAAAEAMVSRGSGRILNVGSTAAIWSRGTYAGGKSWMHAATRGLDGTCRPRGVTATLLIPGFTRTEFHERSDTATDGVAGWMWLTPDQVAREGVDALLAGRPECIPGRRYRVLTAVATRLGPASRARLLSSVAKLRPVD